MAKMSKQEQDQRVIQSVLDEMSAENRERLEGLSGEKLLKAFDEYPTAKNDFINTLTNKISRTTIHSKTYHNRFESLKQGEIPTGFSIEMLFVNKAQRRGIKGHWTEGASTPEADLIRKTTPQVSALYITRNVAEKFKTSIEETFFRECFTSVGGMNMLVQAIYGSIITAINHFEEKMTMNTLFRAVDGVTYEGVKFKGGSGASANFQKMKGIEVANYDTKPQELVQKIRETVADMSYLSNEYNIANVETFSDPNELILITTPKVEANLDVNVLAHAFNMSHAELKTNTILYKELDVRGVGGTYTQYVEGTDDGRGGITQPTGDHGITSTVSSLENSALPSGKQPLAILIHKDFLQIWDKYKKAGAFYNPEGDYTNAFERRVYLAATCLFENAVLFYK